MKCKSLLFVATAVAALSLPILNFAQAPVLGTSGNFVLFTPTGAVTNTGLSQVTGNVGTNNGGITGFGNVNGVMQNSNGATASAAADIHTAYLQLNNAVATGTHAPLLGNGETILPGTYDIAGLTTLSNILTLDAQGNANAVFIFRISAVFNSGSAAQVLLANGALACNVFWKVEGATNLASLTAMKGTIVSQGAIDMASGVKLEGRALSTTGALTTNGVTAKIPTGCGSVILTGPVAPNLGTASCYAIFSGDGPVTNGAGSITTVKGDVGTNATLTSGYNPLLVNGKIHDIPDNSTSAAKADLLNARTYLNALVPDIELLFPAVFGSGLVLTPHTYVLNGATTLTDTVTLNAEGNADAVFVIKVYGAFSAAILSAVKLTNGTQSKNVYWIVNGAVGINDFTDFKGTLVCNNGAIDVKFGTRLDGRVMTTVGSVSTASLTTTMDAAACNSLPVTWLYFRGNSVQKNVLLEWGISNEINNGFFTVEKSSDGVNYRTLGTVNATGGAAKTEQNYSLNDEQPNALNYYRIIQTDKNGQKTYFTTIQVKVNTGKGISATHYVQQNNIYVQTSGTTAGKGSINLYDLHGRKVSSENIILNKEAGTYKVAKPAQSGVYLVTIESNGQKLYTGKVMVL